MYYIPFQFGIFERKKKFDGQRAKEYHSQKRVYMKYPQNPTRAKTKASKAALAK